MRRRGARAPGRRAPARSATRCWGSNGVRADGARRAAASALSAFRAEAPGPPLLGWRASSRPPPSWTIAEPPTADAIEARIGSSPRPSITSRSRRSCTWVPRSSTAYCSLTSRAKARSVIAMNGISYGTSNTGMPRSSASSTSAFGSRLCSKPVPTPSPATSCSASRATKRRCRAAPLSWIPVVSRSSPPESHGVGSSSSEMCTQRIGRSAPSAPAPSSRPQSPTRLPTVSISP